MKYIGGFLVGLGIFHLLALFVWGWSTALGGPVIFVNDVAFIVLAAGFLVFTFSGAALLSDDFLA